MRILVTIVLLVGALSSAPALGQTDAGKAAVRGDAKTTQTRQNTLYRELAAEDVQYRTQRAELRRIEQIAEANKDTALQKRVEQARKQIRARHEYRLAELRKQYGKDAFRSAERRLESAREAKRRRRTKTAGDRAKRDGSGTRGTTDGRRDTRTPDGAPKTGAPAPKTGGPAPKTGGGGTIGGDVPTDRRAPDEGPAKTPRRDDPEIGDRQPAPRKDDPEKPTDPEKPDKPVDPTPDPDEDFEIDEDGKVTLCHKSGNSGKHHTIRVGPAAVKAHLAHGDTLGPCDGDEKGPGKGRGRGPKKKGGSNDDDDDGDDDDDDDGDDDDDDDEPGKGKGKGKSKGKSKGKGPRA